MCVCVCVRDLAWCSLRSTQTNTDASLIKMGESWFLFLLREHCINSYT